MASKRGPVVAMSGLGRALGEPSRCSFDDGGRDVRCPLSAIVVLGIGGEILPACWDGVGLVIPTCKGLKESSNELLCPFDSSVSIANDRYLNKAKNVICIQRLFLVKISKGQLNVI